MLYSVYTYQTIRNYKNEERRPGKAHVENAATSGVLYPRVRLGEHALNPLVTSMEYIHWIYGDTT